MIVFISSRVNDGFSFCQLHFPLPCPVCFADTHNVYDFKGHFSSYLCNVTTSVQCTYIPVSDLLDVLGVYQWPIQPGGACWTGHSAPLIKVNFSALVSVITGFYGRGLSALSPTWRTRGSHLVWSLSFDLVEMGAP